MTETEEVLPQPTVQEGPQGPRGDISAVRLPPYWVSRVDRLERRVRLLEEQITRLLIFQGEAPESPPPMAPPRDPVLSDRDAREWTRACQLAELEWEVLYYQTARSACNGGFERELAASRERLERVRSVARVPQEVVQSHLVPQEVIDKIFAALDHPSHISQVITQYVCPDLTWKEGDKEAKGTCPACGNTRQNFEVCLRTSRWHCWACLEGGNLKSAVLRFGGIDFRELIADLGARVGIIIEQPKPRRVVAL